MEGNSLNHPASKLQEKVGMVITTKIPSPNTDILCARHIHSRQGDYPFLCYKWPEPTKRQVSTEDMWVADWKYWDSYFQSFNPKCKDPSSGTCAIFCAVERFNVSEIGVIGLDWVLDGNDDWLHDAKAERAAIESLVKIHDLRHGSGLISATGVRHSTGDHCGNHGTNRQHHAP